MNTYEGTVACFNLIADQFTNGSAEVVRSKARMDEVYKESWLGKFGDTPITPAEYAPDKQLPAIRPIPAYNDRGQGFN